MRIGVYAAAGATLAAALSACHRAPVKAIPPPAAPFTFAEKTPDASVLLMLPRGVRFEPVLHLKLYAEGKADLIGFVANARAERAREMAKGYPGAPYERRLQWTMTARTIRLIGLRQNWFQYMGGAHPDHGALPLIWDRAEDVEVPTASLFRPDADYAGLDAVLCAAVRAEKARRMGPQPARSWTCPQWRDSLAMLAPSTVDGKAGGLSFHFDPYVLGAGAEGDYDVIIPVAAFNSALAAPFDREFGGAPPVAPPPLDRPAVDLRAPRA